MVIFFEENNGGVSRGNECVKGVAKDRRGVAKGRRGNMNQHPLLH